MKITKVFDIILNISNINDIFSKDINNNLLILIEKKYKHKCYLSSFILKINKIINRSLLECNQNDLNCSFNISIQFEAECLIFSKNEIIMNMQITEKVNNNIILKNKATEDLPDIIISLIKNNLDMVKFNKGDILPIMVGKVKYSLGSDKITINSYPFIPLVSNNIKYKITQLEDSQLELLKETILNYINEEENIKQSKRIKLLEIKSSKKMERTEQGKNVVYLVTNEYLEKDRIFVIGKAISLANRLSQYNKNAEHKVVYHRECNNAKQMSLIEEIILYKLDKYRERANRDRFTLPDDREISLFIKVINDACDWFNDIDEDVVIERLTDDKDKEYYEDNKEYIKEYKKQYYEENKEEINKKGIAWYEDNKEKVQEYNKQYQEDNKDKIKAQKAIYKETHKEEYKERDAKYYREHKDEIKIKQNIYQEENKEKILKQRKEYYNKNIEEIRAKDRARNPKVICECGLSICKRSLPAHQKTKTHERFLKEKNDKDNIDTKVDLENEILV